MVERDARYTIHDISRMVGISLSRVHYILKNILNVRNTSTRWVLHMLADGQKKKRVKIANQLLKMFPKWRNLQMHSLTMKLGFTILNLVRSLAIKYGLPKLTKIPVIAKHTLWMFWMQTFSLMKALKYRCHWKKANHYWKRCDIEEIETNTIRNSHGFPK